MQWHLNVARQVLQLNLLPLWKREIEVWGHRVQAPTLDRLVCLMLHRLELMGKSEKGLFSRWIKAGDTVIDIGANQGLYALLFSKLVGPEGSVLAFEPEPDMFAALQHNCQANSANNVQCSNLAIGSRAGQMKLSRSLVHGGDNRIAPGQNTLLTRVVDTNVATVDELVGDRRVDFIKMDTQGWEWECIRGMERTLEANEKIRIYFEFWPEGLRNAGCNPADLLRHLSSKGFQLLQYDNSARRQVSADLGSGWRGQRFVNILATRFS